MNEITVILLWIDGEVGAGVSDLIFIMGLHDFDIYGVDCAHNHLLVIFAMTEKWIWESDSMWERKRDVAGEEGRKLIQ